MSKQYQIYRVVKAFYAKKASENLSSKDARKLTDGKKVISKINKNILSKAEPLKGVNDDEMRAVLGYITIKRENPVLDPKEGHKINHEGAEMALDPNTFPDRTALEEAFVNQANRLGVFGKKLEIKKNKVSVGDDQ
jgi:hypothetical protein